MKNQNDKIMAIIALKNPAKRLCEILNQLMDAEDIDGMKLSTATGIPVTTINRLRNDEVANNPTLTTLIPLANYFAMSVSQLIGEEALPPLSFRQAHAAFTQVPIKGWQEILPGAPRNHKTIEMIFSQYTQSVASFALVVEENDWENFMPGTILLIDPMQTPAHRDYVIVFKEGQVMPTLKQILFDDDQAYLKSVVQGYQTVALTSEHQVLGVVMEAKKQLKIAEMV